jgi:hypothetical protein
MHSHAAIMEKNICRQNQDGLIIPKHTLNARVFTLGGNPLSCYTIRDSRNWKTNPLSNSHIDDSHNLVIIKKNLLN